MVVLRAELDDDVKLPTKKRSGGGNLGTAEPRPFHVFKLEFAVFACSSQVPTFLRGVAPGGPTRKQTVLGRCYLLIS
jgi:hypothetical protein